MLTYSPYYEPTLHHQTKKHSQPPNREWRQIRMSFHAVGFTSVRQWWSCLRQSGQFGWAGGRGYAQRCRKCNSAVDSHNWTLIYAVLTLQAAADGELIAVEDGSSHTEIPPIASDGIVMAHTLVKKLCAAQLTMKMINMKVVSVAPGGSTVRERVESTGKPGNLSVGANLSREGPYCGSGSRRFDWKLSYIV